MVGRYELVAVDKNGRGKVVVSKNKKKLTLQSADIFTGLFNNKDDLGFYLYQKGYIDYNPSKFVLLYKVNKTSKFLDCLYSDDKEIIKLAKSSRENNKINTYSTVFGYLFSYLIKNADTEFIEYAYYHKYINKYIYDKILEYRDSIKNRSNNANIIVRSIERELAKEYLQVRKLYSIIKIYRNRKMVDITINVKRTVVGESDDPYINYLICQVKNGNEDAYEELKGMDLEKTLSLKM